MTTNKFTSNINPTLAAVSNSDGETPVYLYADPSTHGLVVSATVSLGGTALPISGATTAVGVAIVDGSGNQVTSFGGGTQYAEGTTTTPATGTVALARYQATPATITDGKLTAPLTDANSRLIVVTSGTTTVAGTVAATQSGTWNITNVSGIVSLPTGASTSAKQPALGTAGTASADVITVQGISSMTALKVDGSAVTQPVSGTFWQATQPVSGTVTANIGTTNGLALDSSVNGMLLAQASTTSGQSGPIVQTATTTSAPTYTTAKTNPLSTDTSGNLRTSVNNTVTISGTVTANAGTNLNTSALALESGGNLATLAGTVTSSVLQGNVKQINGVVPLMGNGTTGTGSQRVTIASDNTAFSVNATLSAETTKVIGVTRTADGSGNLLTSTAAALDINIKSGSIGNTSFAATQATASSLNATVVGTGTFAVQAAGDVASGSSDSGNPLKQGAVAHTAAPTAVTDGQRVNLIADKVGKQVVVGSIRDLKGNQFTTITSSTSETTVVTAVASTFLDVYGCIVENTSATASKVTFKDSTAGTTQFEIYVPAGDTRGFMLPESGGFKQTTVNTNWTATAGTSVASLVITMLYVKNI